VYQILEVDNEWNILKCTLHWRRVQIISITLAILEEFLVISLFHETKIPMVDTKVQVYSNFFLNWKKMKSLNSVRNGRFHPSKYRGKLQKMEVMYTHSPKMLGPSSQHKRRSEKNPKIVKKREPARSLLDYRPQLAGDQQLPASPVWVP
jgi:hypothetical protein